MTEQREGVLGTRDPHAASPTAWAEAAAECVRAINHRTPAGLVYPSDAYRVLVDLAALAARLPQALEQVQQVVNQQVERGQVSIADGQFAGDPAAAAALDTWTEQAIAVANTLTTPWTRPPTRSPGQPPGGPETTAKSWSTRCQPS